jgi:putative transposase
VKAYPHFNPSRYGLDVKVARVKASYHCKYNVNYHFVWIPKYRRKVLRGRVKEMLEGLIRGECRRYGWECLTLEVMPDHLHLFLSAKPSWPPSKIVNLLKGSASRRLRQVSPRLRWVNRGYLWASSYYVGTAGHVSQEQVLRYIMEQEREKAFNYDIFSGAERDRRQARLEGLPMAEKEEVKPIPPNCKRLGILGRFS